MTANYEEGAAREAPTSGSAPSAEPRRRAAVFTLTVPIDLDAYHEAYGCFDETIDEAADYLALNLGGVLATATEMRFASEWCGPFRLTSHGVVDDDEDEDAP